MFKRILVPLDGSSVAEGILPYIRTLAPALGARTDLLRTFQNPAHELVITDDLGSPNLVTGLEGLVDQLHRQADEYLQGVAKGLESAGISTTTNVRSGPAAQHIVNEAEPADETLIAMSTHGRTGISPGADAGGSPRCGGPSVEARSPPAGRPAARGRGSRAASRAGGPVSRAHHRSVP